MVDLRTGAIWPAFGDELSVLLKQAYELQLIDTDSLCVIENNLRSRRFTAEHYIQLYSARVSPEAVEARREAAKREVGEAA